MGPYSAYESIDRDSDYKEFIENHQITFDKIGFRIERLLKAVELTGKKGEWRTLADDMLSQATEEADHFKESLHVDTKTLIDLVATAAYAFARIEGATTLAPLANKALKARQNRAAATEAARRVNMRADTPELLFQAKEMCDAESTPGAVTRTSTLCPNACRSDLGFERYVGLFANFITRCTPASSSCPAPCLKPTARDYGYALRFFEVVHTIRIEKQVAGYRHRSDDTLLATLRHAVVTARATTEGRQ